MAQLIGRIVEALIASGHSTLDDQKNALGLARSTTWTIVASRHKVGRLSQKVRARMLLHPHLPPKVRTLLEENPSRAISRPETSELPRGIHPKLDQRTGRSKW
jgi:hypothetical protein